MNIKTILLNDILALHKGEQSKVMPEYYMDNHCWKLIESGEFDEVVVLHEGKNLRVYRKNNLKVVWKMIKPTSREQFGELFESVNKLGLIAEVGVQNGWNAKRIFDSGWCGSMILVDNWVRPEEFEMCENNLMGYPIEKTIKGDSVKSAEAIPNESLDGVYIDAGHSYAEVKADFEAWYPKVRVGGIVSGHDYGVNDCIGVKEFIDEYMRLNPTVEMNFTTDDFFEGREYQSWWFYKS